MKLIDEDATEAYLLDGRYIIESAKHGKWINDNHRPKCSICGSPIPVRKVMLDGEVMWEDKTADNYCSNCGAKMEGERI